jgi:iron complex outermembrane receptor protein
MKCKFRHGFAAALALATVAGCAAAWAESAPPGEAATPGTLEDIVVTARKREEPLEKVPVSVTALSAADLAATFTQSLTDISGDVPNVQFRTVGEFGHSSVLTMRGVGGGGANYDTDPSVAIYVDGLYQTANTYNLESMFGIQSIEVLRGPQGTLFGRNAFAGAINITTKNPTGDWGAESEVTFGNFGRKNLDAAFEFPIAANLSGRVDLIWANSNGFYHNTLDDGKAIGGDANLSIRPTILWKPTEGLSVLFKYNFVDDQSDPTPNKYDADPPGNLFSILSPTQYANYGSTDIGPKGTGGPFDVGFNNICKCNFTKENVASLKVDWESPIGAVTSITGTQHVQGQIQTDATGTPEPLLQSILPYTILAYTEELRLLTKFNDRFQLLSGLYYLNDSLTEGDALYINLGGPSFSTKESLQKRHSAAVFLEGEFSITDAWHLTVGARETEETKNFWFGGAVPVPYGEIPPPAGYTYVANSASWHNFSPKVSLDYQITNDTMTYITWSKGFKSGGFQGLASTAAGAGPYGDETMNATEIGVKSFFFERHARLSADVFYEKLSGLQRGVTLLVNGVSNNLTLNAANAISKGFEAELAVLPTQDLTIKASVGYTDAYYSSFCANFTPLNAAQPACGNQPGEVNNDNLTPSNAPRWTASLGADYVVPVAGSGGITFHADDSYSSHSFTGDDNSPVSYRASAAFLNASIKWSGVKDRYFVQFWGRNLTDKIVTEQGTLASPILGLWNPTPPRTYGVTLGGKL